jgi:hypothetical protein
MGLVAKAPGVDVSYTGAGPWMVYVWTAPKNDWFDLHLETDHPNDYHATISFMVQGRVERFEIDNPSNTFTYTLANASRDLGDRKAGFFRHLFLDDDSLFYQVKLIRPRPIDDAYTTHPVCERITVITGDVFTLHQGDMLIPISGLITVNSELVPNGEVIFADHPANVRGSGVLEYFHA